MSKCIECLHYNACTLGKCDIISGCPFYTSRSEWIHLPCKVGDTLYFVKNNTDACCSACDIYNGYDNYCYLEHDLYPELAAIPICDKQFMEIVECKADLITIVKNIDNLGKTVFLTRDEAEKALEEKREKNEGVSFQG